MALYTFSPPTHEEGIRCGDRWLRRFRITRANSVYKDHTTGLWVSRARPPREITETYTQGVDYFRGGCTYIVDEALSLELNAAGFPTYLYVPPVPDPIPAPPGDPLGYGRGAFGSGPYGD